MTQRMHVQCLLCQLIWLFRYVLGRQLVYQSARMEHMTLLLFIPNNACRVIRLGGPVLRLGQRIWLLTRSHPSLSRADRLSSNAVIGFTEISSDRTQTRANPELNPWM